MQVATAPLSRCTIPRVSLRRQCVRHHMGHGSNLFSAPNDTATAVSSGPRESLHLGLDSARHTQNILRLLEASHGIGSQYADTLSTVWHPQGLVWRPNNHDVSGGKSSSWTAIPFDAQQQQQAPSVSAAPSLSWMTMSDDRTALCKIQGMDGRFRYVSMLRLEPDKNSSSGMHPPHHSRAPNDGWHIVRELVGSGSNSSVSNQHDAIVSIHQVLQDYLSIEHGGGRDDCHRAEQVVFAPQASLVSVGIAPMDEPLSDWSAPAGSCLEISLDTYLQSVESQSPHGTESKRHDAIVSVDVLPCQTAASAIVHVGNGACTLLFCDHLLLGKFDNTTWKILSKTFSPRLWPQ